MEWAPNQFKMWSHLSVFQEWITMPYTVILVKSYVIKSSNTKGWQKMQLSSHASKDWYWNVNLQTFKVIKFNTSMWLNCMLKHERDKRFCFGSLVHFKFAAVVKTFAHFKTYQDMSFDTSKMKHYSHIKFMHIHHTRVRFIPTDLIIYCYLICTVAASVSCSSI